MEIRKAIPADSMTLAMLASRMWDHPAEELAPEFVELTASDEAACFLAFVDRLPVGFAQCQLRHDYVEGWLVSWRASMWMTVIAMQALPKRC